MLLRPPYENPAFPRRAYATSAFVALALAACTSNRSTLAVTHGALTEHRAEAPSAATAPQGSVTIAPPAVPGGHVRFSVQDAAGSRDLPSRLVVRGIDGTMDPELGPAHEAAGANNVVIAPGGRGEITVPPGHYTLTFSHGPEWSVAQTHAEVTAERGSEVDVQLRHLIAMNDWTACDLHVHAAPSFDSRVSIADRVASLVSEGIEFATPSEHNVVGNYAEGVSALPANAARENGGPGLMWVPAVEVTTDASPVPTGHFNVYPYRPEPGAADGAPPPFASNPHEIFRVARANNPNAIIQVNHPRMRPDIGYFDRMQLDPHTNIAGSPLYDPNFDAIEVFNGFFLGTPSEVDRVLTDWQALLGTGARYVGTASSDSHQIAFESAGYPRTYVYTPGAGDRAPDDPLTVIHALRAGHAFGTSGPMLFVTAGEAIPGDTVRTTSDSLALHVKVMAPGWIDVDQLEIYRNGQRAVVLSISPTHEITRFDETVTLPVSAGRNFFIVVARGTRTLDAVLPRINARPMAFTNPIWVERT